MQWQPIDTAPKDGTEVLACRMYLDDCVAMGVASWGVCPKRLDGYSANDGKPTWRAYDPHFLFPMPTHWQPMPEPPKSE